LPADTDQTGAHYDQRKRENNTYCDRLLHSTLVIGGLLVTLAEGSEKAMISCEIALGATFLPFIRRSPRKIP
jgi:hypothetical protein